MVASDSNNNSFKIKDVLYDFKLKVCFTQLYERHKIHERNMK